MRGLKRFITLAPVLALGLGLGACLTNEPDPGLGGIYACVSDDDCPGTQSCLQDVCEAIELPVIEIFNPEENQPFPFDAGEDHDLMLTVKGSNFVLRSPAESSEAVPGEGYIAVFVDEQPAGRIDSGDLSGGAALPITIANTAGAHRLRIEARFNDDTAYATEGSTDRRIVWVDNDAPHVALVRPWPGDRFSVDAQPIEAEAVAFGGVSIDAPSTGEQHVHVFYDDPFPQCFADDACIQGYVGVVPNNMSNIGPVNLPSAGAGPVTLTAVLMNPDHTVFDPDPEVEGDEVFSQIQILRTND